MSDSSSKPLSEAEQIIQLQKKLAWAELKIQVLEERLRLQRIKKYGPGSEKLSSEQLELLELEPGVSNVEVQAESQREPLPAPAKRDKAAPTSGPAGAARRVAACGARDCLRSGTVHLPGLRTAHGGHRLRRQRAVGCGARQVLRGGDQARKAGLPALRGRRRSCGPGSGADHRKGSGQRPGSDRYGGGEIQRSSAAVPPERDSGAGGGRRDQPGDAGRMGDAGGRVTHSHRRGDAPRVSRRELHSGR